jgi:hypothetical protein
LAVVASNAFLGVNVGFSHVAALCYWLPAFFWMRKALTLRLRLFFYEFLKGFVATTAFKHGMSTVGAEHLVTLKLL